MQRDDAYLLDMLVAARRAAQHATGLEPQQFESSLLHQDAIIRELQIVGEAASRVSDDTKREHTEIDWNGIIGLRHRLVHDYRRIRVDVVWRVLKNEVPLLIRQLEQIVPARRNVVRSMWGEEQYRRRPLWSARTGGTA